ncbi:NAD(P)-binding protein [Pleurostoma richardsiae]|uniref:NAD(P)-binding protein n=1 Tax=Pleurostoma richardsiae TaxID=41990 RepID=A0AA38RNE8_9PEZI|nr:NAD(P)-binding protein [Pleurostoma richardsiae]
MGSPSVNANDLFNVQNLVSVVTGGGSGIGLMIAQGLEANGAVVYILGRRKDTLERAAKTAEHGNIIPIECDVTNKADLLRAEATIRAKHGYLNVVVANAGIKGPTLTGLPKDATLAQFRDHAWRWAEEDFTETFSVNTTAVFNTAVAFLGLLDEGNRRGVVPQRSQIIAISSIGAFNRLPLTGYAYGGSKAAVVHIMKQLATSLVPYNIRSNVIAPGFYPSELTQDVIESHKETGWSKAVIPEERPGEVQDMAGAVLFLVSRAGAYINGNVLVTDGGRLGVVPASY